MKRVHLWLTLGLVMTVACDHATGPTEGPAGAPQVGKPGFSVVITPIEETLILFEPNCAGELLELHIRQQSVVHQTVDADGRIHIHSVINDKGTTAVGLTSGVTYHQTGATTQTVNITDPFPATATLFNALNLISEGSGPNLLVQQLFHLTINATGVETVFINVSAIVCQ
jgi:hypothetical protein